MKLCSANPQNMVVHRYAQRKLRGWVHDQWRVNLVSQASPFTRGGSVQCSCQSCSGGINQHTCISICINACFTLFGDKLTTEHGLHTACPTTDVHISQEFWGKEQLHVRELASSMGPSQLFNVACWKIQVGAPGMWSHVSHTIKLFKLVAQNMQIHKVIFGSCHVICDTLTLCTRPSRLLCAALEKLETDYHGARKAVTHNNIQFLHNKNLADATSNYTNYVAASGQVT